MSTECCCSSVTKHANAVCWLINYLNRWRVIWVHVAINYEIMHLRWAPIDRRIVLLNSELLISQWLINKGNKLNLIEILFHTGSKWMILIGVDFISGQWTEPSVLRFLPLRQLVNRVTPADINYKRNENKPISIPAVGNRNPIHQSSESCPTIWLVLL